MTTLKIIFLILGIVDILSGILQWLKTNGDCTGMEAIGISTSFFTAGWVLAYVVFAK